jgi:UDP-perosamine 4-acetyltransferase
VHTLYLCGAGNSEGVRLAQVVVAARRQFDDVVLLDDDASKHGQRLLDVEVIGSFERLADADPATSAVVNLIARTTARRAAAAARINSYGLPFASLVHPGVYVAWARIGDGVLVYEHSIVSPQTELGDGTVVFMRAVVGHESRVGRGCVIAAGAVLNARVVLDDGVYVGSNASILPEDRVGAGATVGANSLVIADVPAGASVVGVPGQVMPPMESPAPAASEAAVTADREVEAKIAAVWAEVLGCDFEAIAPTIGFCHAGGTSLQALRVIELLRRRHGVDVAVPTFFRFPTVRALAAHLTGPVPAADTSAAMQRGSLRRARFASGGVG